MKTSSIFILLLLLCSCSTFVSDEYTLVRARANSGEAESNLEYINETLERIRRINQQLEMKVDQLEILALRAEESENMCRSIALRHGIR